MGQMLVEMRQLSENNIEIKIELNKEIARRKLKEKFAEKTLKNLKEVLEHKGKKVLNGDKIGVDNWSQTTFDVV